MKDSNAKRWLTTPTYNGVNGIVSRSPQRSRPIRADPNEPFARSGFTTTFRSGWGEYHHKWTSGDQPHDESTANPGSLNSTGLYGLPDAQMFRLKPDTNPQTDLLRMEPNMLASPPHKPRSRGSLPLSRSISAEPRNYEQNLHPLSHVSHEELKRENARLKRENQALVDSITHNQRGSRTCSRSSTCLSVRNDLLPENERQHSENQTLLVTLGEDDAEAARMESSWALRSHNKPASYLHHLNKGFIVGTGILVAKTKTPAGIDSAALSASFATAGHTLASSAALEHGAARAASVMELHYPTGQRPLDGWGQGTKPRSRLPPYVHLGRLSALNC